MPPACPPSGDDEDTVEAYGPRETATTGPPHSKRRLDTMTDHKVVSRVEWQVASDELLVREKEHTRMADELARQRREVPSGAGEKEDRPAGGGGDGARGGILDGPF